MVGAGAAWLLGAALLALGAPPAQKPNLLFLQCDEMDGRVLDPTHPLSKVTKMPHLEALAARGVNFIRAYTVNPLCAPSRASTFPGRYASSIRAFSNVKSLTATVGSPDEPDPICADIIGCKSTALRLLPKPQRSVCTDGPEWCVEQGRLSNVSATGTINTALEAAGYRVHLYGKTLAG